MKAKEFIPVSKPRNFVAKNAQSSGAGRHQDSSKKKDQEQGKVKHKKDLIPTEAFEFPASSAAMAKQRDTMTRPISTSTEQVKTFTVDGYTVKFKPDVVEIYYGPDLVYSKDGNYANPTKIQLSGARRIVTHLAHKKKQNTAEGWSDAMVSRRTGTPRTPYSVYIKGKKWKDFENEDHAEAVANKLRAKFKADGRDPETITIAPTDYDQPIKEDNDSEAVERAILNRIMVAHTDLLMKYGPDKVMQAAEEVSYNVGDVDEIGTSDVSAYVNQVRQILGADTQDKLNEKWSAKYKSSINCADPKGFSQKAHCAGRKK